MGPKGIYVQAVLPALASRTGAIALTLTILATSLPDATQWSDFETGRKVMIPNFSQAHAAVRYRNAA